MLELFNKPRLQMTILDELMLAAMMLACFGVLWLMFLIGVWAWDRIKRR